MQVSSVPYGHYTPVDMEETDEETETNTENTTINLEFKQKNNQRKL